jgi:TonB family protein
MGGAVNRAGVMACALAVSAALAGGASAQTKVATLPVPASGWCKLNPPSDTVPLPPLPVESASAVAVADSLARPEFTVAPKLVNRDVVGRAQDRAYRWRDPATSYHIDLWVLIDRAGAVPDVVVRRSSGRREVDEAAMGVGCLMEFTPALQLDVPLATWRAIPIDFPAR